MERGRRTTVGFANGCNFHFFSLAISSKTVQMRPAL